MTEKLYFTYQHIHKLVKKLVDDINTSGYMFDVIVAIGTGGFIPASILKTYINKPILTVGIQYYDENNNPSESPEKIQWIDEVERKLKGKKNCFGGVNRLFTNNHCFFFKIVITAFTGTSGYSSDS